MIISPKVRGFICTTAHPVGCQANVQRQVDYILQQKQHYNLSSTKKNVLVIGASTGYGLASRITAAFGCGANTIGVSFEKSASGNRTASAGWYNNAAFERLAHAKGLYAKSFNGDAFSEAMKQTVIQQIKQDWPEGVDLIIYSLASPKRTSPIDNQLYSSVLKPIGQPFVSKTIDVMRNQLTEVSIEPATEEEIEHTIQVMGGEDWQLWLEALEQANLLAKGVKTIAYSYIGPELTYPIYRDGTIGRAKQHLEQTAVRLTEMLEPYQGQALISVNKALVTQASAAIPVVPLYITLLFQLMKTRQTHEGCIEQMWRLFYHHLNDDLSPSDLDEKGRIRLDDLELQSDVQQEILTNWDKVTQENLANLADLSGYREDFYRLFGFGLPEVDYEQDIDLDSSSV